MNQAAAERIKSATNLGWYEAVGDMEVEAAISSLLESRPATNHRQMKQHSIRDARPDDVRRWFRELPINAGDRVMVLWPALRSAISTTYQGFVSAYDDLWLPGADDVWVRPASDEWLLELDHEEVLRFYERPGQTS